MTINVRKPVEARAEAFISNASRATRPEEPGKIVVNIRSDTALRGRIDANARGLGSIARLGCISPPTTCSTTKQNCVA